MVSIILTYIFRRVIEDVEVFGLVEGFRVINFIFGLEIIAYVTITTPKNPRCSL